MTVNGALHLISVVHELYVARGSGEKGVIGWEDCFRSEEWYVKNEGEMLLGLWMSSEKDDAKVDFINLKRELRNCGDKSWKEKKMYCRVVRDMLETTHREY